MADQTGVTPSLFEDVPSEATAMDEWVALFATRDEMAVEYAKLLRAKTPSWPTWIVLNLAIVDRWSEYGLGYIKTKAWNSIHA